MNASRRYFLGKLAAGMALGIDRTESAPQAALPAGRIHLQPVKEFRGLGLRALSSDGGKLWGAIGQDRFETWTPGDGDWTRERTNAAVKGANVGVVELSSWHVLYTGKIQAAPFIGSFFRDSPELYINGIFFQPGKKGQEQVVVNLQDGKVKQDLVRDALYQTTRGQRLLTLNGIGIGASLSLVELPDYREIMRVNLEDSVSGRSGTDQVVAADGNSFVYGVDDLIVCRRTDNLSILWKQQLRTPMSRVWRIAISAHGDFVAAAAATAPPQTKQAPWLQPLYIAVYDGAGAQLATFPTDVEFGNYLALSPDGRFLAEARRVPGSNQNVDLIVHVYEIASHRMVAKALHASVPPGRYQNHETSGPVEFTADGRYLITEGHGRTRVWEIVT